MPKPQGVIRSRYNYDRDAESNRTALDNFEQTRTQQHFKDEADINVLVKRFNLTGQLPEGVRMPTYADFTAAYDFHSAANAIAEANEAFMQLPADIRYTRFRNDPAAFVAFCSNEANREEAAKLGLIRPETTDTTTPPAAPAPVAATTGGTADPGKTGSAAKE